MAKEHDLRAGQTGMLVLSLLTGGDLYGYEMIVELRNRTGGIFDLKGGTLYPLIQAMEARGWLESYHAIAGAGRSRKYYHLTDGGWLALKRQAKAWKEYSDTVYQVLGNAEKPVDLL